MLKQALRELSRRRVFRGAAIYMIVAWTALQVVGATSPEHDPVRRLALIWAVGLFPLGVLFSWVFQVLPGVVRREHLGEGPPPRTALGLALDVIALSGLALVALVELARRL